MDEQLIQRTRYILHNRVRQVQKSRVNLFPSSCARLLNWLKNHPIFAPIIAKLEKSNLDSQNMVNAIVNSVKKNESISSVPRTTFTSFEEQAADYYHIVKGLSEIPDTDEYQMKDGIDLFSYYLVRENFSDFEKSFEVIKDYAIDGLFEYLDEQLDTRNAIYGLLLKYKQKAEWFSSSDLRKTAIEGYNGKYGERALTIDLQKFIFNQGVDFIIEPSSASGEVDLVLKASDSRYLIIDAKYLPDSTYRSEIVRKLSTGFHQVMRYCEDYNEPEGFLVTFLNTNKRINLELPEADSFSFITIGSKTIYHMFINICEEVSASKSGKADEIIISLDELKSTE